MPMLGSNRNLAGALAKKLGYINIYTEGIGLIYIL